MRSKTSFFNRTLCLSAVRRFWPLWAAYLGIWFLSLPLPLYHSGPAQGMTQTQFLLQVYNLAHIEGLILGAIFSVFAAMAVWSFLYNARSASGMGSLPVRREGQFFSALLAGFLPLAAVNLLIALLTLPPALTAGCGVRVLGEFFAVTTLMDLFFFGFATLCAQLTGHILVLPAVYGVLNFVSVAVEYLVRTVLGGFVYGMPESFSGNFSTLWLCPPLALGSQAGAEVLYAPTPQYADAVYYEPASVSFTGWWVLLLYALVGLVCMALALLLFRRRRMETAGDVVAVGFLRPVFRWCMALGCGLVLASLMEFIVYSVDTRDAAAFRILLVFFLIGAFIGWFAGEMLIKKSFRVFKTRAWAGFGVCCAVILVLMLGMRFDLFGYERRVPKAERIEAASVYSNGSSALLRTEENLEKLTDLHRAIVADRDLNWRIVWDGRYGGRIGVVNCRIIYFLKNGRTVTRYYDLAYDCDDPERIGEAAALQELLNAKESVVSRNIPDWPVTRETITYAYVNVTMTVAECAEAAGYAGPEEYLLTEVLGYSPQEAESMRPEKRRELVEELLNQDNAYYYYEFIGWRGGAYSGPRDLEEVFCEYSFALEPREAEELYRDCMKPDMEDGVLGQAWLLPGTKQNVMEYAASIEIYCDTDALNRKNPNTQAYSGLIEVSPGVRSARTNAWLEGRGLTLHTVGEVSAADEASGRG